MDGFSGILNAGWEEAQKWKEIINNNKVKLVKMIKDVNGKFDGYSI